MSDGRRFQDTGPMDDLEPITDSDWSKLTEPQRAELLLERHRQLVTGQSRIWSRLEGQSRAIQSTATETAELGKRIDEKVLPMLKENTDATKLAAESAKAVADRFDGFAARAESLIEAWSHAKGFGTVVGWVGTALRNVAWIAIPSAVAVGAWQALLAWLKTGGAR